MLTGDHRKLASWSARIRAAAHPQTLEAVSQALADESVDLAREGFDKAQDPFGDPWAPKVIDDGNKPGTASGRTKNSLQVKRVSANGFTVGATTRQSGWLQRGRRAFSAKPGKTLSWRVGGTRYFAKSVRAAPERPIFPTGGRMPQTWLGRYRKRATEILSRSFGSAA